MPLASPADEDVVISGISRLASDRDAVRFELTQHMEAPVA